MRVIVFALHGCPAGWLGAYGNDWVGTPNLDRLAAEGVTFDRHISDCPEPSAARKAWRGSEEPNPPTPFPGREGGVLSSPSPLAGEGGSRSEPGEGLAIPVVEVSPLTRSLRSLPSPARGEGETQAPPSLPGKGVGGLGSSTHTILVRANHPDTDAPDWFYAGWGEVFDARPRAEDASPLEELLRTFPTILDRLADKPNVLLWIETDRLIPPWDVQQDVFEAYLEDVEDEGPPEQSEEEPPEDVESDEDEPEDEEEAAGVEFVDDAEEVEEEEAELPDSAPPEEPVTPFADPPTGPFDRSDLDAWDWLHRTFASVITKLDAELGRLFDDLRARGLDQSAAWVVTSDFGHPLGEHGQIGLHRPWLHEELVHLPLLLRLPGAEQAGRRVAGFTQPPDVYPTLLALLGAAPPADPRGFNLLPLARGEGQSARDFAVTSLELGNAAEIALRTDEWALLVPTQVPEGDPPREPLLFEKPDDRWEVNDLRPRSVERADELEAKLRGEMQKISRTMNAEKDTIKTED